MQIYIFFLFFFQTVNASAYVGPGMGTGIILSTLGVILAIIAALFGLIWFPLKRFLKKRKQKKQQQHKID